MKFFLTTVTVCVCSWCDLLGAGCQTESVVFKQVRMEVAALSLLLYVVMNSLESGQTGVSLTPERSQFFKYESFSVSCEGETAQWRVMKRTADGEMSSCPSPCSVGHAFPSTDSGAYWCESGLGNSSSSSSTVNVTVTAGAVILEGPVLPVTEGDDVTLRCRTRGETSATAGFFRDGVLVTSSATGHVTIRSVSRSDEGLYRCNIPGAGESPGSWLAVTDAVTQDSLVSAAPPVDQDPPAPLLSVTTILRHLMVVIPYLLSTIILGLIYRDRKRELQANETRQPSDDVVMHIVI
ncbi:hypothetical protein INR49_008216 [Caranx melampygus]|nr:hypothetical protein INR49_008216 [Caranx melampygus]